MNTIKSFLSQLFLILFTGITINCYSQQTIAEWNFPNNPDDALVDVFVPINAGASISSQGGTSAVSFSQAGATTRAANATSWHNGSALKWWEITIATTGYNNLNVSSKQRSSDTGPRDFKIQFRVGAGAWTDVPGATSIVVADNFTTGVVNTVALPVICENQPAVSLRWIMTSNTAVGGAAVASGGNSRIDDINISWNSDDYYRSVMTGNWNNIATWESSPDNINWNPAVMPPSNYSRTITIRSPNTVTINSNVNLDETIVENGGTLHWVSFILNIFNGPGVDLQVNGTLLDGATNNVTFNTGATWAIGGNSTVIKTNNGSANLWRDNYEGGIATISATATWIIRKVSGNNPSVSSLTMYYPNLIIENNTVTPWVATGPSSFQGASSTIVVKGYMDVGGSGSSSVEFENTNTNAAATVVTGNLIIRTGNTLRNYGTGFELFSNLICDGSVTYDANGGRRLIFSGNSPQSISGSGNLNIFNMTMNKTGSDLTLLRPIKIDNNITFNNPGGRIFSSTVNLITIESTATATGANNTSFVHGPVQKLGNPAFTFPVGKNNDYQAIAMGVGAGGGGVFWTENFGTGCNTGQLATSYTGANGSWTNTNTGFNESLANVWYVSAAENGVGAGNCGAGCGTNRTLHLSSNASVFGDIGAAYFESDPSICSIWGLCGITDKRIESPAINCTGQSGITLSFNYIEFGEGTNDNATLWYYDGTAWSLLVDLPKTLCCGGVTCTGSIQGLWNAYAIALPASANNNPNVRIGFRWVNNGNGIGTDPSFAVDDITLSTVASVESYTAEYFRGNPRTIFNNNVNPFIDHISACEYWILEQDAGSSSRTVTLTWDGNSCGVTNLPDLRIARFNGLSWDDRGNGGTTGNTTTGTIVSASPQSAYGPFTLASTTLQNPLPVELISLEATFKNETVKITWTTASEINSDYFMVQRSENGYEFATIGKVLAAGNSNSILNYSFTDHEPLSGISYYRLEQIDYDGSSELSKPVAVRSPEIKDILSINAIIASNANQHLLVQIYSSQNYSCNIEIYDATGRTIFAIENKITTGLNTLTIPFDGFSKGVYFLKVKAGERMLMEKFGW